MADRDPRDSMELERGDSTAVIRRVMSHAINADPGSREALEAEHGEVYDTTELQEAFSVVGFAAPFVVVIRKSDGAKGSMTFQARPRFYFNFIKD